MRPWDDPEALLDVDDARDRVLSTVQPLAPVSVVLLDAIGLVLAETIVADVDVPPFRNSAMDGYALLSGDTLTASASRGVELRLVGQQPAGCAQDLEVGPGECVRIMTGAPLPRGADAVVRFEEVRRNDRPGTAPGVLIHRPVATGANVRNAGEDIRRGDTVVAAGTVLRSAEIGLLASLNREIVSAYRRPRIGILSTGDEVIDLGPPLRAGQVRNSNGYMLAGLVRECGGEPVLLGVTRDSAADLAEALTSAVDLDLIVTSGGVSVGDFDVVKDVLRSVGRIALWQVRMRPGKPVAFGHVSSTPLVGLPGNPTAAAITFLQFVWPAMMKMLGRLDWSLPTARARLLVAQENPGDRRHFVRGFVEWRGPDLVVRPATRQGSAMLTSLAQANCLIVLPETCHHVVAGSVVDVQLLPTTTALI